MQASNAKPKAPSAASGKQKPRPAGRPRGAKQAAQQMSGRPATSRNFPQNDNSQVVGANGVATEANFSSSETSFVHPRHGRAVRVRGRELVGFVDGAGLGTGATLLNWDVSPSNLLGSRAAALAALYEKYRFKVMQFEWVPEVGSNTNGKVLLTYDADCLDATPPATLQGLVQATSFAGSKDTTVWKPAAIKIVEREDTLYFTNEVASSDPRFVFQGQFYLMNGGANTLNSKLGAVYLSFEVEFYKPAIEQIASSTDTQLSVPTSTMRTQYGGAKQMFTCPASAISGTYKAFDTGGILRLTDVNGDVFYRVPPGNYRCQVNAQELFASIASSAGTLNAPTINVALPPQAPANAPVPAPIALDLLGANTPNVAAGGLGYTLSSNGDYLLKAPYGADIWGSMGALAGLATTANPAVISWEIERLFGNPAVLSAV